jgi:hypothetical protein
MTAACDRLTTNTMKGKPWGSAQGGKFFDMSNVVKEFIDKSKL